MERYKLLKSATRQRQDGSASQGVLSLRSADHMSDEKVPAELLAVRDKIDETDERLLDLLAERFELTHRVGLLRPSRT